MTFNRAALYPDGDMFGYAGKVLWYDWADENPVLEPIVSGVLAAVERGERYVQGLGSLDMSDVFANDPILSAGDHVQHKLLRVAVLLGWAPDPWVDPTPDPTLEVS